MPFVALTEDPQTSHLRDLSGTMAVIACSEIDHDLLGYVAIPGVQYLWQSGPFPISCGEPRASNMHGWPAGLGPCRARLT